MMNQNRPHAGEGAQQQPAKPVARQPGGKPPPPPVVRIEKLKAACGHEVDFGLFEDKKDKYREARRQKRMGQLCPACREQKEREEQEAALRRRQEKAQRAPKPASTPEHSQGHTHKLPDRLPDGARFNVVYDATRQEWSGTLTVGADAFTASASGVFKLLTRLDRLYRSQVQAGAEDAAASPEGS